VVGLAHELFSAKLRMIASISIDEDAQDETLSSHLKEIEDLRTKVVVVMGLENTYLKVALSAYEMGLVSGWAWLGLDCVPLAPATAPANERANVNLAFNGWIYFEPRFSSGQDFFDRVHDATRSDFPTLFDENAVPDKFAAAMYDSVILFATVANQHSWLPNQGGRAFLDRSIANMSFEGATGLVRLDANGDLMGSYQTANLVLKNGTLQRIAVGVFGASAQSYSSNGKAIIWPGGLLTVPTDTVQGFSTVWLLVGASGTALVVTTGLVILVRRKRMQLQAILLMVLTEAGLLVFSVCMSIANLATDAIVFRLLLRGDLKVSTEIYTVAYATILCFGVVATVLSLGYRIRNACLMRAQLHQLAPQDVHRGEPLKNSDARRLSQQHEWELVQMHRTKVTLSLSLTSAAAQGAHVACELALHAAASFACNLEVDQSCFCRFADVRAELLPDLRRGQHRQGGARASRSCSAFHRTRTLHC
jgi:hypothetical protein